MDRRMGCHNCSSCTGSMFQSALQYKLAVTVLQCLHNRAPKYLVDYCIPVFDVARRQHFTLRQSTLDITRMCRATDEAHSVAGPCLLGPDDPERTILGLLVLFTCQTISATHRAVSVKSHECWRTLTALFTAITSLILSRVYNVIDDRLGLNPPPWKNRRALWSQG